MSVRLLSSSPLLTPSQAARTPTIYLPGFVHLVHTGVMHTWPETPCVMYTPVAALSSEPAWLREGLLHGQAS